MDFDVKQFVRDRDEAFTAFVLRDDLDAIQAYCRKYDVPMPDNPNVIAAGV